MWVVDGEVGRDSGFLLKRVDIAEIINIFYLKGSITFKVLCFFFWFT